MLLLLLLFSFFMINCCLISFFFFFFNDTATTEIYTLSLHDALPISSTKGGVEEYRQVYLEGMRNLIEWLDRKSTRLNSSHDQISYAVFCLKKKKKNKKHKAVNIDKKHYTHHENNTLYEIAYTIRSML